MATTWSIEIDWDRNGNFTGTHDDITSYVMSAEWFLGARKPYKDMPDNGTLNLTLNNADKRFSPENDSSPLAGVLHPHRPIRVQSDDGTTVRTHWTGWIESITPDVGKYGQRRAKIRATGAAPFFSSTETSLVLQENKRTDEIIQQLVEAVNIDRIDSMEHITREISPGEARHALEATRTLMDNFQWNINVRLNLEVMFLDYPGLSR